MNIFDQFKSFRQDPSAMHASSFYLDLWSTCAGFIGRLIFVLSDLGHAIEGKWIGHVFDSGMMGLAPPAGRLYPEWVVLIDVMFLVRTMVMVSELPVDTDREKTMTVLHGEDIPFPRKQAILCRIVC